MAVTLLLFVIPVAFVTGYLFGLAKTEGTLELIPVKQARKPAGPFTRNYPIEIDGTYTRHN